MPVIGPGGWDPSTHFHVGRPDEPCWYMIRAHGHTSSMRCGQPRLNQAHRYYRCPADRCYWRGYSIQSRLNHLEREHPDAQ